MASTRNRRRRRATLIGSVLGFMIIVSFLITLIAPDIGSGGSTSSDDVLFNTPEPTAIVVPTPEPTPQVVSAAPFIHRSGVFRAFQPAGPDWTTTQSGPTESSTIVRVVHQNADRLAVIHNYIQPGVEYETHASLSENFLTAAHFQGAWDDYASWIETRRTVTDEAVVVDFDLSAQGVAYSARSTNWLDGGWLYVTHVVVPDNNPALLDLLTEQATAAFAPIPGTTDLPLAWPAFVDQLSGYILKYPPGWQRVAGDVGRPATFANPSDQSDHLIRTWAEEDVPLETAEEAADWLVASEDSAVLLSSEPAEGWAGSGYALAYTFTDAAGDPRSGLAMLLNDAAGTLFVADLRTELLNTDLLTASDIAEAVDVARRAVQEGFVVLPEDMRRAQ